VRGRSGGARPLSPAPAPHSGSRAASSRPLSPLPPTGAQLQLQRRPLSPAPGWAPPRGGGTPSSTAPRGAARGVPTPERAPPGALSPQRRTPAPVAASTPRSAPRPQPRGAGSARAQTSTPSSRPRGASCATSGGAVADAAQAGPPGSTVRPAAASGGAAALDFDAVEREAAREAALCAMGSRPASGGLAAHPLAVGWAPPAGRTSEARPVSAGQLAEAHATAAMLRVQVATLEARLSLSAVGVVAGPPSPEGSDAARPNKAVSFSSSPHSLAGRAGEGLDTHPLGAKGSAERGAVAGCCAVQ